LPHGVGFSNTSEKSPPAADEQLISDC
jgi:hypothetical protein